MSERRNASSRSSRQSEYKNHVHADPIRRRPSSARQPEPYTKDTGTTTAEPGSTTQDARVHRRGPI